MSRTLKICLILFFILVFSFNIVQATSEDSAVPESDSESTSIENSEDTSSQTESTSSSNSLSTLSGSSITKVSNINSYEQANLQLNNILCVILIAIGVLLILFAIAILIRLSK